MTAGVKQYIFIRDDDVYALDNNLLKTIKLCLNEKIPVIYSVIPHKLKKDAALFLSAQKIKHPYYLDIAQHGLSHINHNKGSFIQRHEFGPDRNYKEQKKDIRSGYARMISAFGKMFTPAFIPPYHYYDKNTLKVISELKIPIFSAGIARRLPKNKNFTYLAAQVSLNKYDSSFKSLPLSLSGMLKETLYYLNTCNVVGIYFHHSTLDRMNFGIFAKYIVYLKNLAEMKSAKFILFSDILKMLSDNGKS